MAQKPTIPKGTRDFGPLEMARRNYIFDNIRDVFKMHGYVQIETPAMETLQTLMGKYGEEGDRLIFRILNSGDFSDGISTEEWNGRNLVPLSNKICEKALRYDLTVPFARYVVMHRNEITLPFKRFQIQPVWRADRPQKGRYREFYQCDVDVIGSNSLLNEVELVQIVDEIFQKLDLKVVVKINNRKILSGIAEILGHSDKIVDITVAIDKLDKIGLEGVNAELEQKGLSSSDIAKLQPILNLKGKSHEKLEQLKSIFSNSANGQKGIKEMEIMLGYLDTLEIQLDYELDLTLARGLNYYTGAIFEVKSLDASMGSISGGGRYDDLTGVFGLNDVSGVGISFGADRIYDILLQLGKFPERIESSTRVLLVNFGGEEEKYALKLAGILRKKEITTELYPSNDKLKKQFGYADSRKIPFVVIAGNDEIANRNVTLKNMITGEQLTISESDLYKHLL